MKKILLIIVLLIVCLVGVTGGIFFATTSKKAPSTVLSERSQEFMDKQKGESHEVWRNVDVQGEEDAFNQHIQSEQCFEYTVPFSSSRVVTNGGCSQTVYLKNPSGQLTVALSKTGATDVSETSGVAFRRSKGELYTESDVTTRLGTFISFTGKESGFEQTAFLLKDSQLLTIALTSPTNEDLSGEFIKLLQSVTLPK